MSDASIIRVQAVTKRFQLGKTELMALKGVDISIAPQEFLAIAGSSGSGKTTLLNLIGCIDTPTTGEIWFDGVNVGTLTSDQLAKLRAEKIGFIFQTFNLLPVLTALENVEYPLGLVNGSVPERRKRAEQALDRVGLGKFMHHRPAELSGGQRQRVAIARALVKTPRLILADEPTANLDSKTAKEILELMKGLNRDEKVTFVFTSHDPLVHQRAARVAYMVDGQIRSQLDLTVVQP